MTLSDALAVLGAVTGLIGCVMGYLAYSRTNDLKALDLRMQLRQSENTFYDAANALLDLMPRARRSREAINAATGAYQSGAMQRWHQVYEIDLPIAQRLSATEKSTVSALSESQIELRLGDLHGWHLEVQGLAEKYRASFAEDDVKRAQLAAAQQARTR